MTEQDKAAAETIVRKHLFLDNVTIATDGSDLRAAIAQALASQRAEISSLALARYAELEGKLKLSRDSHDATLKQASDEILALEARAQKAEAMLETEKVSRGMCIDDIQTLKADLDAYQTALVKVECELNRALKQTNELTPKPTNEAS